MNTWVVGKDMIKHHCLIKKVFYKEDITDDDHRHAKMYSKSFIIKI